jgi:hypothetical protein
LAKLKRIYETLQLKMKLTTGDSKKSIFKEVRNMINTDFVKQGKNAIVSRVEKMTHLIRDRRFSSYKDIFKNKNTNIFLNVVDLDNLKLDTINYILNTWSVDKDLNENYSTIKFLEDELKAKTEELKQMKKNELERICREYFKNDYERRFKVPIEVIMSALVGDENLLFEIGNYKRLQRVYLI